MRRRLAITMVLGVVAAATFAVVGPPAGAAPTTWTVTTTADPGDGTCDSSCSLRDALLAVNANADDDVIEIPAGLGTITLDGTLPALQYTASPGSLTINGHGNAVVQPGAAKHGLDRTGNAPLTINDFDITGTDEGVNVTGNGAVVIADSVITGGDRGMVLNGPAVFQVDRSTVTGPNLGFLHFGTSTVTDSTIEGGLQTNTAVVTGSTVTGTAGGDGISAASITVSSSRVSAGLRGLVSAGTPTLLVVSDSQISGANASVQAGVNMLAIRSTFTTPNNFNVSADGFTATLVNSTVSGHSGLGVRARNLVLLYTTISGTGTNLVVGQGGIGSLTSFGTVVAGGGTCSFLAGSATATLGYNYEQGNDTCGFGAAPGDVVNGADPQLGALAANGGIGLTHLPAANSPLLDRIPVAACPGPGGTLPTITTDERGVARPQGSGCDIGAVEVVVATFTSDDLDFTG